MTICWLPLVMVWAVMATVMVAAVAVSLLHALDRCREAVSAYPRIGRNFARREKARDARNLKKTVSGMPAEALGGVEVADLHLSVKDSWGEALASSIAQAKDWRAGQRCSTSVATTASLGKRIDSSALVIPLRVQVAVPVPVASSAVSCSHHFFCCLFAFAVSDFLLLG